MSFSSQLTHSVVFIRQRFSLCTVVFRHELWEMSGRWGPDFPRSLASTRIQQEILRSDVKQQGTLCSVRWGGAPGWSMKGVGHVVLVLLQRSHGSVNGTWTRVLVFITESFGISCLCQFTSSSASFKFMAPLLHWCSSYFVSFAR